jgi:hypothetical protein
MLTAMCRWRETVIELPQRFSSMRPDINAEYQQPHMITPMPSMSMS